MRGSHAAAATSHHYRRRLSPTIRHRCPATPATVGPPRCRLPLPTLHLSRASSRLTKQLAFALQQRLEFGLRLLRTDENVGDHLVRDGLPSGLGVLGGLKRLPKAIEQLLLVAACLEATCL